MAFVHRAKKFYFGVKLFKTNIRIDHCTQSNVRNSQKTMTIIFANKFSIFGQIVYNILEIE